VHAGRRVGEHDRRGLERLLHYMLRPPISNDRVIWGDDEHRHIHVRLKRAWSDGTTHLVLSPTELVEKLVPLIPPPWLHRVRYHGVLAPNAKLRSAVAPAKTTAGKPNACEHDPWKYPKGYNDTAQHEPPTASTAAGRASWAALLARVFSIDVLECPRCKARMQQIAVITQGDVATGPGVVGHAALATTP